MATANGGSDHHRYYKYVEVCLDFHYAMSHAPATCVHEPDYIRDVALDV
jgi:hypothetical protein